MDVINVDWGWRFAFGIDGFSLIMLLLTAIVTFAAVWFTAEISRNEGAFYACLLFISARRNRRFRFDRFVLLLCVPRARTDPDIPAHRNLGKRQPASRGVENHNLSRDRQFHLLLGLILLYRSLPEASRSFDFAVLQAAASAGQISAAAQQNIYLLLLIGFGILVSLFPFHTWAPEAYASAPSPAAMLHAGVLKKFGLYGLLRLAIPLLPAGARYWNRLLIVLLLGNIIYVGLVTIAQKRLDWMLGYSSVMHMGYIFLGIASANIVGIYRRRDSHVRARTFDRASLRHHW